MSQTPVPPGVVASVPIDPEDPLPSGPASEPEPAVFPASTSGPTLASGLPVAPVELDPALPKEPEPPVALDPAALDPVLAPVLPPAPELDPVLPVDPAEPLEVTPELAPEEAPLDESPLPP
jgi:hypothetical protein